MTTEKDRPERPDKLDKNDRKSSPSPSPEPRNDMAGGLAAIAREGKSGTRHGGAEKLIRESEQNEKSGRGEAKPKEPKEPKGPSEPKDKHDKPDGRSRDVSPSDRPDRGVGRGGGGG